MRAFLAVCASFAVAGFVPAQDTAPASRPWEPVRFHRAGDQAPLDDLAPVVRASHGGDELVVLADGNAMFTYVDSSPPDGTEAKPERWVARIPVEAVDRLTAAVRSARERGETPSFDTLLDLARVPSWIREEPRWGRNQDWIQRHQEPDGSWSPADFDWNCRWEDGCTGRGKEGFRVAATALILQLLTGAGYPSPGIGYMDATPRRATTWLISRQQSDGGFAPPGASKHMNDACATIALSRALALASSRGAESRPAQLAARAEKAVRRIAANQKPNGGWSGDEHLARRLSTDAWCLLALRAGSTAGLTVPQLDVKLASAAAAIEQAVASAEASNATAPALRLHARAVRAVARAAAGAKPPALAEDVAVVLRALKPDQDPPPDAEVLLFTTIAAMKCSDSLRDEWLKVVKPCIIDSQVKDGCASGTWSTPTIWWDEGGRLVSTALMTWVLELYYRYPHAEWV